MTTHLHLALRPRMNGAIHLPPSYASMEWEGITSLFYFTTILNNAASVILFIVGTYCNKFNISIYQKLTFPTKSHSPVYVLWFFLMARAKEKLQSNSLTARILLSITNKMQHYTIFFIAVNALHQRFSNFLQVRTTFISQNVLRTTLLLSPLKENLSFF
jgi:hypothetical protein